MKDNLEFCSVDCEYLARKYATPLYVMSQNMIEEKIDYIKEVFLDKYPNTSAYYSGKAFLTKAMVNILNHSDMGLDVVSYGELYIGLNSGLPSEKIIFQGSNKSIDELEFALERGVKRVVVDSLSELELLIKLAKNKYTPKILLRISTDFEPKTHKYLQTGNLDSKFGLSVDGEDILKAIKIAIESDIIELKGFHFHMGSQLFSNEAHIYGAKKAMELIKKVKEGFNYDIEDLDVGGGFAVRYTSEDEVQPLEYYTDAIMQEIESLSESYNVTRPHVIIEPGRYVVAEAGITLYTVGSIKEIPGIRKYIYVDGGMADNPRPSLYQSKYSACIANKLTNQDTELVSIAGKCCESSDILVWDVNLPKVERGDILAIMATGAYNYSMSSNYSKLTRPAVVMIHNKEDRLIVQRESYDDLLKNDLS